MRKIFIITILSFFGLFLSAQTKIRPPFLQYQTDRWVDSVFNSLTVDEKIGQLILVPASTSKDDNSVIQLVKMIKENKIGGIISTKGEPVHHVNLINQLQKVSKTPILVAIDTEYDLLLRPDSCIRYPNGSIIGAMSNDSVVYELGAALGKQGRRMGIHIYFTPGNDVNRRPFNPVSCLTVQGESLLQTSEKAVSFGSGMQSQRVLAPFEGLAVVNATSLESVTEEGDTIAEVKALIAGNDLLVIVDSPFKVVESIKKAIADGQISLESIDLKCRKTLMLKRWVGLDKRVPLSSENLYNDLNRSSYRMTLRNVAQQSLTVLRNDLELIPLLRLDTLKIATLSVGSGIITEFQRSLERYTKMDHYFISKDADETAILNLMLQLKKYNLVIGAVNNLGNFPNQKQGITNIQQKVVQQVALNWKSVFVIMGNPCVLNDLDGIERSHALVMAYQESFESQDLAGQLLFGAFGAEGRLPVTVNENFRVGDGLNTANLDRFKYTLPEELGVDSIYLKGKMDSLVSLGLSDKAFPGCAIFLAKDGKVFFNETYGYQTYSGERPLLRDDLFDFASLTKIIGPVPALMRLYDEKKIEVNNKMSDYWPDWKGSNKQGLILADVLSHQARLKSGIPFWMKTLDNQGNFRPEYYARDSTEKFSLRVSKDLYILNSFRDSVYAAIKKSTLLKRKKYAYSDIGFIIFPRIIETISQKDYELYLKENFYQPLGAYSLTYRPYLFQPIEKIDPTENDVSFRKELLQGFVHDESAAVMGGISGNAGLFGTINDAAKVMQMYLNYGYYGGSRYLTEATMKEWTIRHFEKLDNRRGYGFDKPYPRNNLRIPSQAYPAPLSSDASFGHSGFTGTFAWADPKTGILFLFFSNRVYPTRSNNTINHLKLRESIQEMAYKILKKGETEVGRQKPGVGSKKPGAGSPKPGVGSPKTGVGSKKTGAGSPKTGVGSKKPGVGSPKTEVGSKKPVAGSPKPGVGSPKTEVGSKK